MFWLTQLTSHPVAGAVICLLLAGLVLALRQLAHRSRFGPQLNASFTLIACGLIFGALATLSGFFGIAAAVPYLSAIFEGAVAIGIVRAGLTTFVEFYLSQREGATVSAIVRDVASVIAYFLVIVFVLRSTLDINLTSLIATSAVLTVIVGLALQDVLSNLFSGLVLELEQPFSRGDWVRIGAFEGTVEETGWRTTKIRTRVNELITLPNALMSKEAVVNYSRPDPRHGDTLSFEAAYEAPPNVVKEAVMALLASDPNVLRAPEPEVRLVEYGDSSIKYAIRYWITDFAGLERIRDHIMTRLWYALRRANVRIPYPARDLFIHRSAPAVAHDGADLITTLGSVSLLAPLDNRALAQLAQHVRRHTFGWGEVIVREGETSDAFYVIERGTAEVMLDNGGAVRTLGQLRAGEFFGEMSLLAGEPCSATVRAATDLSVLVVDRAAFKEILSVDPKIIEPLSEIAARRQHAQEDYRRSMDTTVVDAADRHGAQRLRERIKAFFGV
jgi:small-conductance mechanosensitive channel/CRP-like cAMP-binding protein